ncbi:hypothetical protein [Ancylobacter oerskovii]|uniref:Uncharacterized protein n=1 Tax=Ancylobacter oerskovii TaxID=459519 RepID=A0ABW4Z617_9HYPH|nr:hypothetical protein [Ancylobacter oerskovii]MBS7545538.1 hypothetical protein [Ancylobacter oerskovii]
MLKSGLIVVATMALSISAAVAGVGEQRPAASGTATWAANEVHALYDPAKQHVLVDVNDQFSIKSRADGDTRRVQLAVLDGARAKIGTCADASKLQDGERRTTWLDVQYGKPDAAGNTAFTIRRTLDFNKHERVYRFTAGDGARAALEPGVTVSLNNGVLVYEQTSGPIGTSGNTKAMRMSYKLTDGFGDVTAGVELDRQAWAISTTRPNAAATPVYSVNNSAVLPHVAGTEGTVRDHAVIANPVRGPGIGAAADPTLLKASGAVSKSVQGLQVQDEAAQLLCISISCSFDFQCTSMGAGCICHDLDGPGPLIGVCQV